LADMFGGGLGAEAATTTGGLGSVALETGFDSSTGGCNSAHAFSALNTSTIPKRCIHWL
jgi:hypothetical protein